MTTKFVPLSVKAINLFVLVAAVAASFCLTAPAFAANVPQPCSGNSETRQFDFLLGKWSVTSPGGTGGGTSTVQLDLDNCFVIENWEGGEGHRGRNVFAYSYDDKTWHGMFADNEGRVHVFEGKVASGTANFHGTNRGPEGKTVLDRIRIARISPDKSEETWEKSSDSGKNWMVVYRGEYSRVTQ